MTGPQRVLRAVAAIAWLAAFGCIAFGAFRYATPLGLVVAGVELAYLGIVLARASEAAPTDAAPPARVAAR